jgi:predicted phosphodiesterase
MKKEIEKELKNVSRSVTRKLAEYDITEKQLQKLLISKEKPSKKVLNNYFKGKKYVFGAIGDTHFCSKEEKIAELETFYQLCKKRGVKDVYHAGDILTGQNTYHGQEYEVHTFGLDNQVDYCVKHYPVVKGIQTHFITGNHDYSFFKRTGCDIGPMLSSRRKDLSYLGQFSADVKLAPDIILRLVHPDKAGAYAITYHAQKFVEQIMSGTKPNILLLGHTHCNFYFNYRNIATFGVGCFEGQTNFLLRKGINPVVGGWIITITAEKGSITSINGEFIPFYQKKSIK